MAHITHVGHYLTNGQTNVTNTQVFNALNRCILYISTCLFFLGGELFHYQICMSSFITDIAGKLPTIILLALYALITYVMINYRGFSCLYVGMIL